MAMNPELRKQLERAGTQLVQAVLQLKCPHESAKDVSPEEMAKLAQKVLSRVETTLGRKARRVNVLRHLGTIIVEADAEFVESLATQPEVAVALPNQTAESPTIPPVAKRKV